MSDAGGRAAGGPSEMPRTTRSALRTLSFLAGAPLPNALLAVLGTPDDLTRLRQEKHLIRGTLGEVLSPEIAGRVREGLRPPDRQTAVIQAVTSVEAVFPSDVRNPEAWPSGDELLPHAIAALGHLAELDVSSTDEPSAPAAHLLFRATGHLESRGDYVEARQLLERHSATQRETLAPGDPLHGDLLRRHGEILSSLSHYADARRLLDQALSEHVAGAAGRRHTGLDHLRLAETLDALDLFDEALEQVDAAWEDLSHSDAYPRDLAAVLRCRGWIFVQRGRSTEGVEEFRRALEITTRAYGSDHLHNAETRATLAFGLQALGDHQEARAELDRALADSARVLAKDHPDIGVAHSNLGGLLLDQDDLDTAEMHVREAVRIAVERLPEDHRARWSRHVKLADVLQRQGRYHEALEQREAALAVTRQRGIDVESSPLVRDLEAVSAAREATKDRPGAREAYEEAWSIVDSSWSDADPVSHAHRARKLAGLRRDTDDPLGALAMFGRAIRLDDGQPGADPAWAAHDRIMVASLLEVVGAGLATGFGLLGDDAAATTAAEHSQNALPLLIAELLQGADTSLAINVGATLVKVGALEIAFDALDQASATAADEDDPIPQQLSEAWEYLGRKLAQQDSEKALPAFQRSLELLPRSIAKRAAQEATILQRIADAHLAAGRIAEAIAYNERAVERLREIEHPRDVEVALLSLGIALAMEGDHDRAADVLEESIAAARGQRPPTERIEALALRTLGQVLANEGRLSEAEERYEQALAYERRIGNVHSEAILLQLLGRARVRSGDAQGAVRLLRQHLALVEGFRPREPDMAASAHHDLADAFALSNDFGTAIEHERRAIDLIATGDAVGSLLTYLFALGRFCESAERYGEALEAYERRLLLLETSPTRDPGAEGVTLHDIGDVCRALRDYDRAIASYRGALERKRAAHADPRDVLGTLLSLGRTLQDAGEPDEAVKAHEERLAMLRELPDRDLQGEGVTLHDRADSLLATGLIPEAVEGYRDAADHKRRGGQNQRDLATTLVALGRALEVADEPHRALDAYRDSLNVLKGLPDRDLVAEAGRWELIGQIQLEQGEAPDAASAYRLSVEHYQEADRADRTGRPLLGLAAAEMASGRVRHAAAAAASATRAFARNPGRHAYDLSFALLFQAQAEPDHPDSSLRLLAQVRAISADMVERDLRSTAPIVVLLAATYELLGHRDLAVTVRRSAGEVLDRSGIVAPSADARPLVLVAVSTTHIAAGRLSPARRLLDQAYDRVTDADRPPTRHIRQALLDGYHYLGRSLKSRGAYADAVVAFQTRLAILAGGPAAGPQDEGVTLHDLADIARATGDLDESVALYEQAITHKRRGPNRRDEATTVLAWGRALAARGDYPEALIAFERRQAMLKALSEEEDPGARGVTFHDAADVHRSLGDLDAAMAGYRAAIEHKELEPHPPGLATTFASLARVERAAGDVTGARRAALRARELLHGERQKLHTLPARKHAELHAQPAPWPRDAGTVADVLGALDELQPRSIAQLERLRQRALPAYRDGTDWPHAGAALEVGLVDELIERGLVEPDADAAPVFTHLGKVAADLLRATGRPEHKAPDGFVGTHADPNLVLAHGIISARELLTRQAPAEAMNIIRPLVDTTAGAEVDPETLAIATSMVARCLRALGEAGEAGHYVARAAEHLAKAEAAHGSLITATLQIQIGRLDDATRALSAIERCLEREPASSAPLFAAQIGVAWHVLGAFRERAEDFEAALAAYERSAALLERLDPRARRELANDGADLLRARGRLTDAADLQRQTPWPIEASDVRVELGTALVRLARVQILLDDEVAAWAGLAQASAEFRSVPLAVREDDDLTADLAPPAATDADEAALSGLTPYAIALLERLRQDALEARQRRQLPGLPIPTDAAWTVLHAARELKLARLVASCATPNWIVLTPAGVAAARRLAPAGPATIRTGS